MKNTGSGLVEYELRTLPSYLSLQKTGLLPIVKASQPEQLFFYLEENITNG